MATCDACGELSDGMAESAEAYNGETFLLCDDCKGYKTLRVPTADWVAAQRQRDETGRTWGEQIVRPDGNGPKDLEQIERELDAKMNFPTADVKEAVRDVVREELPEGALR